MHGQRHCGRPPSFAETHGQRHTLRRRHGCQPRGTRPPACLDTLHHGVVKTARGGLRRRRLVSRMATRLSPAQPPGLPAPISRSLPRIKRRSRDCICRFEKSERDDLREEDERGAPEVTLEELQWPNGGMNHHVNHPRASGAPSTMASSTLACASVRGQPSRMKPPVVSPRRQALPDDVRDELVADQRSPGDELPHGRVQGLGAGNRGLWCPPCLANPLGVPPALPGWQ
jgi:hypothetical protein